MTILKKTELVKPGDLKFAPHERGDWFAWVGNEITLDKISAPGFFAHHSATLKRGSRIEVLREDMSLDVLLRVIRVEPGLVYTRVLTSYVNDENVAVSSDVTAENESKVAPGYKVGYMPRGQFVGHFVMFNITGNYIAKGLNSRKEAIEFTRKHWRESNPGGDLDQAIAEAALKAAA